MAKDLDTASTVLSPIRNIIWEKSLYVFSPQAVPGTRPGVYPMAT